MNLNELTKAYLIYWGNDEVICALLLARFHLMMAAVTIAVLRLERLQWMKTHVTVFGEDNEDTRWEVMKDMAKHMGLNLDR